jgi:hypothetical protein
VSVQLSCATLGATIYYTTDGTTPTTSSAVYSNDGILLRGKGTHVVEAKGVKTGYTDSAVASATFTIN